MFDVVISGGRVIDGTGNPEYRADVGIRGERIAAVGNLGSCETRMSICADGMIVAPGFIDIHSHSGRTLLLNPLAESDVRQGVTTDVIGNCGQSLAPLSDERGNLLREYMDVLILGELDWNWSSMGDYVERLQRAQSAVNVVPQVGHGTVRIAAMGLDPHIPSTEQMARMKYLVAQSMEEGAWGLSSGLVYPPGCYSRTDELVELARVAARYGGFYSSHIRNEGNGVVPAVEEAIAVGERACIPVEISHHKIIGRPNWGATEVTLDRIQAARKRGVDVALDFYPYLAIGTSLGSLLPPWTNEGGISSLVRRVAERKNRERIRCEIESGLPAWWNPIGNSSWNDMILISVDNDCDRPFLGKTVEDVSQARGIDGYTAVFDLLVSNQGRVNVVMQDAMSQHDLNRIADCSLSSLGSDGAATGVDGNNTAPYGTKFRRLVHPRSYGTYSRFIERFVIHSGCLAWEEAIRRMTSLPASRIGLLDRGTLREGMWADVIVINPSTFRDKATYANPHQYPEGVDHVLVNGQVVLAQGIRTTALPGKVLTRV